MAVQTLNTIKNWFKTGLKPSQAQFWDTWDSFRHKSDKVPVADVEGINELLAQVSTVTIYKYGQLCIFKDSSNVNNSLLEPNDTVIGFVEGEFLNSATYYGGDPALLSSYEVPLIVVNPFSFWIEDSDTGIPDDNAIMIGNVTINVQEKKYSTNNELEILNNDYALIKHNQLGVPMAKITYYSELFDFSSLDVFSIDCYINALDVVAFCDILDSNLAIYAGNSVSVNSYGYNQISNYELDYYAYIEDLNTSEFLDVPLFKIELLYKNLLP